MCALQWMGSSYKQQSVIAWTWLIKRSHYHNPTCLQLWSLSVAVRGRYIHVRHSSHSQHALEQSPIASCDPVMSMSRYPSVPGMSVSLNVSTRVHDGGGGGDGGEGPGGGGDGGIGKNSPARRARETDPSPLPSAQNDNSTRASPTIAPSVGPALCGLIVSFEVSVSWRLAGGYTGTTCVPPAGTVR